MPRPYEPPLGSWVRYSAYEVTDGWIRPAPGAELTSYDPWREYEQSVQRGHYRKGGTTREPSYQSLLSMLPRVVTPPVLESLQTSLEMGLGANGPLRLDTRRTDRLASWCVKHGVLGVFSQRCTELHLAPKARLKLASDQLAPEDCLSVTFERFYRAPGKWEQGSTTFSCEVRAAPGLVEMLLTRGHLQLEKRGSQRVYTGILPLDVADELPLTADNSMPRPRGWGAPRAVMEGGHWVNLAQARREYFPTVPEAEAETFRYPFPASAAFWELYAESVDSFLLEALSLSQVLATLQRRSGSDLRSAWNSAQDLVMAVEHLNRLTRPVGSMLDLGDDGRFGLRSQSLTLLSSYAVMILREIARVKQIKVCSVCRTPFISDVEWADYCTDRCRHTAAKRRYRNAKSNKEQEQPQTEEG